VFVSIVYDVHFIKLYLRTYFNLQGVKKDKHILYTLKRLLKGVTEGMGRRRRRRKQLLVDVKEIKIYWKLKEEALYRTLWRILLGRGCETVARQTT